MISRRDVKNILTYAPSENSIFCHVTGNCVIVNHVPSLSKVHFSRLYITFLANTDNKPINKKYGLQIIIGQN